MKASAKHLVLTHVSFRFLYPSETMISIAKNRIGE